MVLLLALLSLQSKVLNCVFTLRRRVRVGDGLDLTRDGRSSVCSECGYRRRTALTCSKSASVNTHMQRTRMSSELGESRRPCHEPSIVVHHDERCRVIGAAHANPW